VSDFAVKHIAILGGNIAAFCYAALLKSELGDAVEIQMEPPVRENPGIAPGLVLEGQSAFHGFLGLDDGDLLLQCDAQFGLGTMWRGWLWDGHEAMLAGSENLPNLNGVAFHQLMLRAATGRGEPKKMRALLEVFQLPSGAARLGKFTHPAADPESPRSMLRHQLQVDAALYTKMIRMLALDKGVLELWGPEGDLIIDCRPTSDTQTAFPFDVMISGVGHNGHNDEPYASTTAVPEGIFWRMPTATNTVATLVYSSEVIDTDRASAILRNTLNDNDAVISNPVSIGIEPSPQCWIDDTIIAGPRMGSFGPLQSLDIAIIHRAAIRLAELIPVSTDWSLERSEYNRLLALDLAQANDIASLPFTLNQRSEPIWKKIAALPKPDTLALRIAQFESRGRVVTFDNELLTEQEWVDRFCAFGVQPSRYDPLTDLIDMNRTGQMLDKMAGIFGETVVQMPSVSAYRGKYLEAFAAHKQSG
jgi:tryptophan 7-halogenase